MSKNLCDRILSTVLYNRVMAGILPKSAFATQTEVEPQITKKAVTSYASQITALTTPYDEAHSPYNNSYVARFDDKAYIRPATFHSCAKPYLPIAIVIILISDRLKE